MKHHGIDEIKESFIEGIDDEFQDLAASLSKIDFSKESNKDSVFNTIEDNIGYKQNNNINKIKKTGIAVASLLIISTILAQTTFAKDVVNNIIKTISLGNFTAIQTDESKDDNYSEILSDDLKGKLFDKNGNALEKITKDIAKDGIYTKDGEKVDKWTYKDGTTVTKVNKDKTKEDKMEEDTLYITDSSKINDYTCFDVKLPSYLPSGYTFEKAGFYKDESGNVKDSKYAELHFKNSATGEEIYMQERLIGEDTRGDLATDDKIESIKINGVDAVLEGENDIDWEMNNTHYFLAAKNMTKDEVVKIAESIK